MVDDYVRISKFKNKFAKSCTQNCSEELFVINEVQDIDHGYM